MRGELSVRSDFEENFARRYLLSVIPQTAKVSRVASERASELAEKNREKTKVPHFLIRVFSKNIDCAIGEEVTEIFRAGIADIGEVEDVFFPKKDCCGSEEPILNVANKEILAIVFWDFEIVL